MDMGQVEGRRHPLTSSKSIELLTENKFLVPGLSHTVYQCLECVFHEKRYDNKEISIDKLSKQLFNLLHFERLELEKNIRCAPHAFKGAFESSTISDICKGVSILELI
jgi:hypothetical protein